MARQQGFNDGDRVRDRRDGSTGTVRTIPLDPGEDPNEVCTAEVRWDSFGSSELELDLPHLEREQ
ncbi:hypothetical protein D5S17_14490 [Pseudonocardiaceae bacterium YIM PH 21723]|nr:hypothetical protein D5S17_14490 [Pseudonocardiaceae bacterium YIM PH 21723]